MKEIIIENLEQVPGAAAEFARYIGNHSVIAFHGSMGAGKTTFIRELARHMGVGEDLAVNSPSFSIINEYRSDTTGALIYHFDLYRLESLDEAMDIGVEDYIDSGAICLIEWPDVVDPLLPADTLDVRIEADPATGIRRLTFYTDEDQ